MRNCGERRPGASLALMAVLVGVPFAAQPALAFEVFVHRFFEAAPDAAADVSPDAQRYTVDVSVASPDSALRDAVEAASALWTAREDRPPPSTAAFLSQVAAEYGRITAALYREGHYGGAVDITVGGKDPDGIAPDAVLSNPVAVKITVDPGPEFHFGDVHVDGQAPALPDDRPLATPTGLGLVSGQPARAGAVVDSEKALIDAWRRQGHPLAAILSRDTVANHDRNTLDVSIKVDPGPLARFGGVAVTGTSAMDPAYVAWMTGIQPGQRYDPAVIARGEKNLRRLGVFSSQRIEEAKTLDPNGQLPLTLNVAERPLHVFGGGVTYSTLDGAGLEGYWQHRNLFGHAEQLKLSGEISGIDGTNVGDFTYAVSADFSKPGIFTPFTDLTAGLSANRSVYDSYTETAVTAKLGLAHAFDEYLSGTVGVDVTASRDSDPEGTDKFLFAGLPATLAYDSRDSKTDPHEGFTAQLALTPFQEFSFGNTGLISEAKATGYWAMDASGDFVLAGRLGVGSLVGAPSSEMPNGRLFYAGGGSSVRGYSYRNLGPTSGGKVVGGLSYVDGSVELRAKLTDSFGAVIFADAGNAFASSYPDFDDGVKIGVGAGIRYYTGLGPVRLDMAVPLDPGSGDPSFAIYAGLGQSF
ncbi:autotransporter assembly complex protein TamA [Oryzibacter oryziterrae]|uniref:autotransporter assembly complex protein TamA n=1 Tax=Oryzibacter oryziterrae TaxID=2766474 RepID=UPI001F48477E|nr:autotransporter assembly complex family protein [Oryzibacter oryziterrae]